MKAIIPENEKKQNEIPNLGHILQTPEDAKVAARKLSQSLEKSKEHQQNLLESTLQSIAALNPELGGLEEMAALMVLPDEQFALLAPVFLRELEKLYHHTNNQIEMVQMMNIAGFKSEDVHKEFLILCKELDKQMSGIISGIKLDFLKRILGMTYDAMAEAEGVAKKTLLLPIQYIHADAKMPAYAHATDAGMDVYALEDITIAPGETKLIHLGIKVAVPAGYELQVRPKSGISLKTKLRVANAPGTIDAGYRDEICVIIDNIEPFIKNAKIGKDGSITEVEYGQSYTIGKGQKIAQLVLNEISKVLFYEITDIESIGNDGRDGGFGSTGLN
jgi:dUTP pyrophosphatase